MYARQVLIKMSLIYKLDISKTDYQNYYKDFPQI